MFVGNWWWWWSPD